MNREVAILSIDTTDVKVDQSSDAFAQMQTYSGDRGKGHCYLFSNVTDNFGSIVAVTPGPNISCTPRGGDGISFGVQLGLAEDRSRNSGSAGFAVLLNGTATIGVALNADRGYIYQPNVNRGSNPTYLEYCNANDILPLYRPQLGQYAFMYDRSTDRLIQVQNNRDPTRAVNSGRVTTYLRAASENAHTFKNRLQYLGHRAHNSRLVVVGRPKVNKYSRKYSIQYPDEVAEMSKLNVEYLVGVGLYNWSHAKFQR